MVQVVVCRTESETARDTFRCSDIERVSSILDVTVIFLAFAVLIHRVESRKGGYSEKGTILFSTRRILVAYDVRLDFAFIV